jgi:YVTN family beta-propeller protein
VTFTPHGERAYVANKDDGTVSVITTATGVVSDTIKVGNGPIRVAICPA